MSIDVLRIDSTVTGIPSRNVQIYLPPGYDERADRGYPVIYMHDGQNVFAPGTEFGCWYAEQVADKEISAGHIPPFMIAAIDNHGEDRTHEYVPPGDRYKDRAPGMADRYTNFVLHDVMPVVKSRYNVTEKRAETAIAGSSLGGVVSLYMGFTTDAFGMIGSLSTAICHGTSFLHTLPQQTGKPLRIYHDIGSGEYTEMAPDDYEEAPKTLHNNLKQAGYREPYHLRFVIDEGGRHNEAAWHQRLPDILRWMFGDTV